MTERATKFKLLTHRHRSQSWTVAGTQKDFFSCALRWTSAFSLAIRANLTTWAGLHRAFEREKSASSPSFVQALHGQKGEQNSCSLVKDLLLKCVIIITLITHCHWIYFDAKMKHVRCERLLLCCVSRQSVLARGWISACVELLQPPTEIAFDTDSNDSMCVVPFRTPLGFGSAE